MHAPTEILPQPQRVSARADALPAWLIGELRSDHAGETGAVMIYRGILAVSRDPGVRRFSERHRATEQGHLDLLSDLLPPGKRSRLLPLWRVAGWLTGAIPALFGPRAVYATIDAVETFVDHHYQAQIDRLDAEGIHPDIRALLEHCRIEEVHHRDEARDLGDAPPGPLLRFWSSLVGAGSAAAVAAARRV
jgi:ubiquinone biosynthesis monooxygenase Coq7